MNRLSEEMQKVMWTMDADKDTEGYEEAWERLWMLNDIKCAIRYQKEAKE